MLRELFSRRKPIGPGHRAVGPIVLAIGHVTPGGKDRNGTLSVSNLREVIADLARRGYTVHPLRDLARRVASGASDPANRGGSWMDHAVALAIEGGCSCQREYVLPLLRAMKLPHTLFLCPSSLGKYDAMSRDDVRVAVREGTGLGGLWDANESLDELGTMEAAWNLEILAYEVTALAHPEGKPTKPHEDEPWLSVTNGEGGDRVLMLARAAGFGGILDGHRVAGRHHLPRHPILHPRTPKAWRTKTHSAFQGVCAARR